MMKSFILTTLVLLPGVWSGDWAVSLTDHCALRGTSVVIQCEYDYPWGHVVTSTQWYKGRWVSGRLKLDALSYFSHIEYLGDRSSDCRLRINNVQHSDAGQYYFYFRTTFNRWRSRRPAILTVRGITAVVQPSTVTEGDPVHLTCLTGCPTPVNVVWLRDEQPVSETEFKARRQDAGRYSCAVLGQATARSTSVALDVQYAPRLVSLSVSPPVVVKGSSVLLTCSSDANPPVTHRGYSLYKDKLLIASGQNYNISDIQPSHSRLFWCQAWNNISRGGDYLFNSTQVYLDVLYPPLNISVVMDPPHVTEGNGVNLTCSSSANPSAVNVTWFRRIPSSSSSVSSLLQVGSGRLLSLLSVEASHMGHYFCQVRNMMGENNSTDVLLTISADYHGSLSVPILAGVGVFLFLILLLAFFMLWRRKMTYEKEETGFDSSLSSTNPEDPVNSIYVNVTALRTSSPPQDVNPHTEAQTSLEGDVTYSTVTIKPKNSDPERRMNRDKTKRDSWSGAGDNEDSVIYSTLAKTS